VSTGGKTAKPDGAAVVGSEIPAVAITGLHKWFGEFRVLADINLEVAKAKRIVIAAVGVGKSTLLRCVNALEEFQRGEIVVNGLVLTKDVKRVDAIRRDVGMVFQHFNLFRT
jgi:general L-amino acid transport system ATP-binding protein